MLSLALIDSDVPRRNVTLEPSRSSIQCAAIQTPIIGDSVFQIWKRHFHAWIWLLLIGKCRFLIWILRFQIWKRHFHAWIWLLLIGKCRFLIWILRFQIWKCHFHAWIWLLLIGQCRFLIWILHFQIWKRHFHAWIWLFLIGKCRFHACDQIPPWVLLQSALFHAQVPGLPKAGRR